MKHIFSLPILWLLALGSRTATAAAATTAPSSSSTVAYNCTETKMLALQSNYTACFYDSDVAFNATVGGTTAAGDEAVKEATCKRITEQDRCFSVLDECFADYSDSFLIGEFFDKMDHPHLQPFSAFVKSCPVLADNEARLVKKQYHVDNCTFEDVRKATSNETMEAGTECFESALLELNGLTAGDLAEETSEVIAQSFCGVARSLDKCIEPHRRCSGVFESHKSGLFDHFQQIVRIHVAGFSFDSSCID